MSEHKSEMVPLPEASDARKERPSARDVTIEILDRINLDVRARENEGRIEAIVDSADQPREDRLEKSGLLVDELNMDALTAFFREADVEFVGDPWIVRDREDFLGEISISASDLNRALKEGKLVLTKQTGGSYSFEGLREFVQGFVDTHLGDDKYNTEEDL